MLDNGTNAKLNYEKFFMNTKSITYLRISIRFKRILMCRSGLETNPVVDEEKVRQIKRFKNKWE